MMSKHEENRALAMRAIIRQIQAKQEKAFAQGQSGGGLFVEVQSEAFIGAARPPRPLTSLAVDDARCPLLEVLNSQIDSFLLEHCEEPPWGTGCQSPPKKCTKHSVQRRPHSEGGRRHYIEFLEDASTRKVSAADGFFFPQDEEWL